MCPVYSSRVWACHVVLVRHARKDCDFSLIWGVTGGSGGKNHVYPCGSSRKQSTGGGGEGAARGHYVVYQPHVLAHNFWRGLKAVLHVAAPSLCAQPGLLLAGYRPHELLGSKGHLQVPVYNFGKFVRLVVAPVPQVVGMLRYGGYHIGAGQTAHAIKHKAV